jgi:hypothetical protein
MHDEQVEAISAELVKRWGPEVKRVTHELNALIGKALSQGDLLAFGFISQAVGALMLEAVEMARGIQTEQHGAKKGHLH